MQHSVLWLPLNHLSCTSYCNCCGGDSCYNPNTKSERDQGSTEHENDIKIEDVEDAGIGERDVGRTILKGWI